MSKLKERLIALHISFNKEIVRYVIITILLLTAFIVAAILTKLIALVIVMIVVLIAFTYLYFSRYKGVERKQKEVDLLEFVNLFTFFKIYLKNGFGVYASLKEISNFANESLKEKIEKLLQEIDEDKSVTPFVNFASYFDELIVEEMMISIYQMIDDGSDSNYLIQFELIFDKFSELLHKKQLDNKDKGLSNLTASALVGSAYLIIVITIGVVTLLGDMINGL